MWAVFFGWPVCAGLGIEVVHVATGARGNDVAPYIAIPVFLVAFLMLATFGFKCPRCGQEFYRRDVQKTPFARRCMNCGLKVGAMK